MNIITLFCEIDDFFLAQGYLVFHVSGSLVRSSTIHCPLYLPLERAINRTTTNAPTCRESEIVPMVALNGFTPKDKNVDMR